MFQIKVAEKTAKKLKIGFSAPSGAGKTMSALLCAYGITEDYNKIVVIDTENKSSNLYSYLGPFNVIEFDPPYSPKRYIEAIDFASSQNFEVIIIDSISHEWMGKGGCLEIVEKLGGTFREWAKVTPLHNQFIEKILSTDKHIFVTIRRKEEYTMSTNSDGKATVKKLGLTEVQRDGLSYELDLVFDIDINHYASVSKDRTGLFIERDPFVISEETGQILKEWSGQNTNKRDTLTRALEKINDITKDDINRLNEIYKSYPELKDNETFIKALKDKKEQLVNN